MADVAAAPAAPTAGTQPGTQPQNGAPPAQGQKLGETAAQTQARMLKLMLGGKEVELPESEVVANFEKGRNSAQLLSKVEQRRQEALKAKLEAEGLVGRLKDKKALRSTLVDLGYTKEDLRRISEETILQEIELEKMTPAERRAYEAEQRLKTMEEAEAKRKEEEGRTAHEKEVARHKDEFANLFLETMSATGLPKESGRYVAHRMAHLYRQNEEAGLESTPHEMAAWVMEGLKKEHVGVLSGLQGDALLEYLGKDMVNRVLGAHLARVKASRGGTAPAPKPAAAPTPSATQGLDPRKGRWAHIEKTYLGK